MDDGFQSIRPPGLSISGQPADRVWATGIGFTGFGVGLVSERACCGVVKAVGREIPTMMNAVAKSTVTTGTMRWCRRILNALSA